MNQTPNTAFSLMSWAALVGGTLTFNIGLFRADMLLNEKGFYFAVLCLGLFSAVSLQKTVRDKLENVPTTPIYYGACIGAFVISILLLLVGLWNATLLPSEKGFYGIAFFLCIFGSICVQKNIRDTQPKPTPHEPAPFTTLPTE